MNSYIRDISPKQQNLRSCWLRRFFLCLEMRGVARWAALASRLSIGVARLLSPLFGYAEWLEPYGLHARVQRKIRHSFSLRSNIGGFCRTDFVSSSGTPPNTQRATPAGRLFVYRGSQIRTDDILLPKQTLYQAELHPEVLQI